MLDLYVADIPKAKGSKARVFIPRIADTRPGGACNFAGRRFNDSEEAMAVLTTLRTMFGGYDTKIDPKPRKGRVKKQ